MDYCCHVEVLTRSINNLTYLIFQLLSASILFSGALPTKVIRVLKKHWDVLPLLSGHTFSIKFSYCTFQCQQSGRSTSQFPRELRRKKGALCLVVMAEMTVLVIRLSIVATRRLVRVRIEERVMRRQQRRQTQ